MFDYDISSKKHFTGKDGEQTFVDWLKRMHIQCEDFPFRVKTGRYTKKGSELWLNVTSWGFYQGSDWRWYVFISYRTSDNKYTCAYHWDVDEQGIPVGKPRKHEWNN